MGFLFDLINRDEEKSKKDLEREMNAYGLEEWQKKLVREGKYDPWNFTESNDLCEYDYYYEDDK